MGRFPLHQAFLRASDALFIKENLVHLLELLLKLVYINEIVLHIFLVVRHIRLLVTCLPIPRAQLVSSFLGVSLVGWRLLQGSNLSTSVNAGLFIVAALGEPFDSGALQLRSPA